MAKTLSEAPITTATARGKLGAGEHARRLDADAALWYRKGKRGGVWFARWRNFGPGAAYKQASLGAANDANDKPMAGTLTFLQAESEAKKTVAAARLEAKALADGPPITVRSAVEDYIAAFDARESKRQGRVIRSDTNRRMSRHLLGQPKRGKQPAIAPAPVAAISLATLKERNLRKWRDGLPEEMKATTRQRLTNDLRAALNNAFKGNRDRLPPSLPVTIKHGLQATISDEEAEPVARDNQILTDGQVARLLRAAREIDTEGKWEGDLFRLVLTLAATGARFSQLTRMKVGDCQLKEGRLMVPVSRKGRGGKTGHTPIPVGRDVLDALTPIVPNRPTDAPLFERWRHKQINVTTWKRVERSAWKSSAEFARPWNTIRERAQMPEVIAYALRHTSIVRVIRANLPIRLVAALHDTSVPMIEQHYSRWISTGLEDMARAAIVPLVPSEGGADVVRLRGAS